MKTAAAMALWPAQRRKSDCKECPEEVDTSMPAGLEELAGAPVSTPVTCHVIHVTEQTLSALRMRKRRGQAGGGLCGIAIDTRAPWHS